MGDRVMVRAMMNICMMCGLRQCNNPSPCCKECDDEMDKNRQPQSEVTEKASHD